MKFFLTSSAVLLLCQIALAQQFKVEADLPKVGIDAFYRVALTPTLDPYINSEFSNVRIYAPENKEVPFLFRKELPVYYTQKFRAYEILENKREKKHTTLIFKNSDSRPINNIFLSIKNADVVTMAFLVGSDDKENWFALKDRFTLMPVINSSGVSEVRIIDFPLSNYTYYKLQIDCRTTAPLNILKAGYYEVSTENGEYTKVEASKVIRKDTVGKSTYVKVKFDSVRIVDKLLLSMSGAHYFLRHARVYARKESTSKGENRYILLVDSEVSSKQESVIELPGIALRELLVIISNEDNPALDVASVKAYRLNRYCIAWLQKDKKYKLKIGKKTLASSVYDLEFFKDSIPSAPQLVVPRRLVAVDHIKPQESSTFLSNRLIIWVALILVIAVLAIMSLRLVRDTNANVGEKDMEE